jgi:hypothetical protein
VHDSTLAFFGVSVKWELWPTSIFQHFGYIYEPINCGRKKAPEPVDVGSGFVSFGWLN